MTNIEKTQNYYAPVCITTLNRHTHFIRLIESLKKCTDAQFTDIYIALDFPLYEHHRDGYEKINYYLNNSDFSAFKEFHVIRREKNYGAGKNVQILVEMIREKYDRYISLEDDIEVSANFLVYMDQALQFYLNDEDVVGVSAYSYPVRWKVNDNATVIKQNFVASHWGIGRWTTKMNKVCKDLNEGYLFDSFKEAYSKGCFDKMIDAAILDYESDILRPEDQRAKSLLTVPSDVAMRVYLAFSNKYYIMPTFSKSRNYGFDGSGVYCSAIENGVKNAQNAHAGNYYYAEQPIDDGHDFELSQDDGEHLDENRNLLNEFDYRSPEVMSIV